MKKTNFKEITAKLDEVKAYLDTVVAIPSAEIAADFDSDYDYDDDFNCVYNSISYINDRINDLWNALYTHMSDGHVPALKSAEQMQRFLDVLNLNSDFEVQKQTIYASDGKVSNFSFLIKPKAK